MTPIEKLYALLEKKGIYEEAIRLLKEHAYSSLPRYKVMGYGVDDVVVFKKHFEDKDDALACMRKVINRPDILDVDVVDIDHDGEDRYNVAHVYKNEDAEIEEERFNPRKYALRLLTKKRRR